MSEKLANIQKKGGEMSETVLWTNPSPTSSFAGQSVALSDSLNNYKAVRLYWRMTTTNSSETHLDIDVSDYTSVSSATGSPRFFIGTKKSTASVGRSVSGSNTTANFGSCSNFGASGNDNICVIPTKVCGLK